MPVSRATFSIDRSVLDRFNRMIPAGDRSKYVENLLERDLKRRETTLDALASDLATHPDLKEVRADSELWSETGLMDGLDAQV